MAHTHPELTSPDVRIAFAHLVRTHSQNWRNYIKQYPDNADWAARTLKNELSGAQLMAQFVEMQLALKAAA